MVIIFVITRFIVSHIFLKQMIEGMLGRIFTLLGRTIAKLQCNITRLSNRDLILSHLQILILAIIKITSLRIHVILRQWIILIFHWFIISILLLMFHLLHLVRIMQRNEDTIEDNHFIRLDTGKTLFHLIIQSALIMLEIKLLIILVLITLI